MIDGQHAATVSMILSIAESARQVDVMIHDHHTISTPLHAWCDNSTATPEEFLAGKKSFSSTLMLLSLTISKKPNLTAFTTTLQQGMRVRKECIVHCLFRGLLQRLCHCISFILSTVDGKLRGFRMYVHLYLSNFCTHSARMKGI